MKWGQGSSDAATDTQEQPQAKPKKEPMSSDKPLFFSDSEEDEGRLDASAADTGPAHPTSDSGTRSMMDQMKPAALSDSEEDLVMIADNSKKQKPLKRKIQPSKDKARAAATNEPAKKKIKAVSRPPAPDHTMRSKTNLARETAVQSPWEYKVCPQHF